LVNALMRAIQLREQGHLIPPDQKHAMVKNMYAWSEVAKRTERVYAAAMRERPPSWWAGIKNYYNCGIGFGILYIWVALTNMMCLLLLDLLQP
uniref:Squalene--hopene cyclase n=1 Tax=Anisakis simplex TaxID=6269 RepID=A0A0M3JK84_ANISI